MAQIQVVGDAVVYDGDILYPAVGVNCTVRDNYENYQKSLIDVAAGDIAVIVPFTNNVNMEEQYLAVEVDFSDAAFNTVGSHEIFTVTGGVEMRIIPECTDSLTAGAGATIGLGVAGATGGFIADTDFALIDVGEVWDTAVDATITKYGDASAVGLVKRVFDGLDVGYEIKVAALTGGIIVFHCYWTPLNATGAVAAGTGAAL